LTPTPRGARTKTTTPEVPAMARIPWFDEKSKDPLIDNYVQKMETFLKAMAYGKIDAGELKAQEERLVKSMKEVEALLDDKQHAKVTQLLCELTAYDVMQSLCGLQQARPKKPSEAWRP
jgi:hypothetical protein